MSRLLCKVGVHTYRFKSCDPFAMCAAEICKHCGRGRIMHFAGAYQYFDAKAMETGTAKTAGLGAKHDSAVATAICPGGDF